MVVMGAGTCGTLTGVGRKIKEHNPNCKVIAVDPYGSILAQPPELNDTRIKSYIVEGIGKKFIPAGLDHAVVDKWYKMHDKDSFFYARKLVNDEGLLCGGSSGSALAGAISAIKDFNLGKGQRCVIILPDSIRNYMSRFANDDWMIDRGFIDVPPKMTAQWWWYKPVTELELTLPSLIKPDTIIFDAVKLFKDESIDYIPVIGKEGDPIGILSVSDVTKKLSTARAVGNDPVSNVMMKKFEILDINATLGELSRILNRDNYVLVSKTITASAFKHRQIVGVVTGTDFLNYITAPPLQNALHE
jgi:cystathionine beta-synthase